MRPIKLVMPGPVLRGVHRGLRRTAKRFKKYPVFDVRNEQISPLEALALRGRYPVLLEVPLDQCRWTGSTGLPYGPKSAHPYVQTLLQYREHGQPSVEQSYLYLYYKSFQPASLAEFQGLDEKFNSVASRLPPLNIYPWTPVSNKQLKEIITIPDNGLSLPGSFKVVRSCGPKPARSVQGRLDNLFYLYEEVRKKRFLF